MVLGHNITAGGIRDGEAVLEILSEHPSTARFISTKLVRKFVADEPPESLVKHIAETYRKSDGDLREMMHAIITSKEFNAPEFVQAKTKTPFEYAVSAIRLLDGTTDGGRMIAQAIARMGQPLYQCQPPTGYPDRGDHWLGGTSVRVDEPLKSVVRRIGSPEFQMR